MKQFIIWDPRDGSPHRADGSLISDGLIGRVGADNVYLRAYPQWPSLVTSETLKELRVGACIRGVRYNLSGTQGTYDIYRVS